MQIYEKLIYLLTHKERKNAVLLLFLLLIVALLDMIGVASILPFMAVLANPSLIETNIFLKSIFQFSKNFGVENKQQFLIFLGIVLFLLLIVSLAFKAISTYAQVQFIQMRQYTISKRIIADYLKQPYSWFLDRHSADLGKTILSEVGEVVSGIIRPLLNLIAKGIVTIGIIVLLIVVDPKLALIVGFFLSSAYGLVYYLSSKYLKKIGNARLMNNELRFTIVSEAFSAAKELKVGGLEQTYIDSFSNSAYIFAKAQASSQVIEQLPRFFLEALVFGGILLIIIYKSSLTGSFNEVVPIISLYAFAGYRLMPAIQEIYGSFSKLAFFRPSLDILYEDLKKLKRSDYKQEEGVLPLNKSIELKNISYSYPNSNRTALKDINILIPSNSTIGLVGATGSGKTTTVDIILGLLEAQNGNLEIDGKIINQQNSRSWQRSIGYVPQQIYLSDDTISANIAFGVNPNEINQEAVERASKISNSYEFIKKELPNQFQTNIGERGVKLSGGQRQRIGIARAIYHNPQVLILDEATSALDNLTEKAVMNSINNLKKNMTIIIISHRLSTVEKCDKIFFLEKGTVKNEGTFKELISINENFRLNANIN